MASLARDKQPVRSIENAGQKPPMKPRQRGLSASSENGREPTQVLPPWMRLYFYGMHGITLDIILSAVHTFLEENDFRLLGFSSPCLCIMRSVIHLVLEKMYSLKKTFHGHPIFFHCVLYPSVYIGLQILISNAIAPTYLENQSVAQLAIHYILALYYSKVFYKRFLRLRYHHCPKKLTQVETTQDQRSSRGLPGILKFVFFGMHGFLDEVLFTSTFNLIEKSKRSLTGHTSLWSFLMYGSCSFVVEKLYLHLHFKRGWGTWKRLPIYIGFIYTWEFSWGLALRHYNACSWDYSHYPLNLMGLITLLYLPGWVCLSLYQDVLSNVLMRVVYATNQTPPSTGINGRPHF